MRVWRCVYSGIMILFMFSSGVTAAAHHHSPPATIHKSQLTPDEAIIAHTTPIFIPIDQEPSDERRQTLCLALGLYHEARGEPWVGQRAVGHVILNRVNKTGDTICKTLWKHGAFSWTRLSMQKLIPHELDAWITVQWNAIRLQSDPDNTQGATMFYNDKLCHPKWANTGKVTAQFGNHVFINKEPTSKIMEAAQ